MMDALLATAGLFAILCSSMLFIFGLISQSALWLMIALLVFALSVMCIDLANRFDSGGGM